MTSSPSSLQRAAAGFFFYWQKRIIKSWTTQKPNCFSSARGKLSALRPVFVGVEGRRREGGGRGRKRRKEKRKRKRFFSRWCVTTLSSLLSSHFKKMRELLVRTVEPWKLVGQRSPLLDSSSGVWNMSDKHWSWVGGGGRGSFTMLKKMPLYSHYPTTKGGGVKNGSSVGIHDTLHTCSLHVLARTCRLSRCLATESLHRSSARSLLRVRCWLGRNVWTSFTPHTSAFHK